jgi:SAM-dependent methyltransferase
VNAWPQWNNDTVRQLERSSIRSFMERNRQYLKGRVLDFGAGKQPYRDLVDGEYVPFETNELAPPRGDFDCIMCNQVIQYIRWPGELLDEFCGLLSTRKGHLVMTSPLCWDEVEATDLWRFTKAGMEMLLSRNRWSVLVHERRAEIDLNGFKFPLGYGLVARAG